jgi:hypothetical protein
VIGEAIRFIPEAVGDDTEREPMAEFGVWNLEFGVGGLEFGFGVGAAERGYLTAGVERLYVSSFKLNA